MRTKCETSKRFNRRILGAWLAATFLGLEIQGCRLRGPTTTESHQSGSKGAEIIVVKDSSAKTEGEVETAETFEPKQAEQEVKVEDPNADAGKVPQLPGAPVVGIIAVQDGKPVQELHLNKSVVFMPAEWTKDTSASAGCPAYPGIMQAAWTIGSMTTVDLQRFPGQDCRDFNYSGTFTKEGTITVKLDVVAADGEQAHAEANYKVIP